LDECSASGIQLNKEFKKQFIVSSKVYQGFIQLFDDKNPLHTDSVFAKQKGFEEIVMHGNILNGFLSYFVGELLPVKNVIIHSQEINYRYPVYLNDSVTLIAEAKEIHESVNTIIFKFSFTNQNNKTIAKGNIQIGLLI
jgi:3-hydroxybutyryl-CoA dehydratase